MVSEYTIGSLFDEITKKNRVKVFLYFEDETISYGELKEKVDRIIGGCLALGLKPGDKCYILLPNCPEYVYLSCAFAKMGVVSVLVNFNLKGKLLSRMLSHDGIHTLIVSEEYFQNLTTIEESLKGINRVVVLKTSGAELPPCIRHSGRFNFTDLLNFPSQIADLQILASDPMSIIFTSGTTGYPKGVICPHRMVFTWAEETVKVMRLTASDRWYNVLPLYHGDGHFRAIFGPMMAGASLVLRRKFSAGAFWDEIRKFNVTAFSFIGTMLVILYNLPEKKNHALNPAKRAAGAPIPEYLHLDFERRFDIKLINEFGMSEIGNIMAVPSDITKLKTAGKIFEGWEAKIFDNEDNEMPPNKTGELVVRPLKPYIMMRGYYNDPENTLDSFRNLWFHTGDFGYFDEEGYFFFVDRGKDSLRVKGENISSVEFEEMILTLPFVKNCAAIGVPSKLTEDDILLVIELKKGALVDAEKMWDYCKENLPKFMIPRYIRFVNKVPLNELQKLNKEFLRKEGVTDDTWDSQTI